MLRGVSTMMECAHVMGKKFAVSPFFDSIPDISAAAKLCFVFFRRVHGDNPGGV